jgi:3-hydroxybutyryl-CoA dehydratase
MLSKYFEEHQPGEGGRSRSRTITEADIVGFAGLSGDWHSLHTDREYAARSRFGQRIAHGMLVLSVASGLIDNDAPYAAAFYGMNNVQFRQPTFIGDTIHVQWEVIDIADHDEGNGIVTWSLNIFKQTDVMVARAEMRMLVAKAGGTAQ